MFDGKGRQRTVSAAGLGRKGATAATNKDIIENARKQREQRQEDRIKQNASIKIQSMWRGVRTRNNVRKSFQQEFDAKLAGVQKIRLLFQQTQKKAFLVPHETLFTLMRLYRASQFSPSVPSSRAQYLVLLGLLNESFSNPTQESNILYLLADSQKGLLGARLVISFVEVGLGSLGSSSSATDWNCLADTMMILREACRSPNTAVGGPHTTDRLTQVVDRLRRSMLSAALYPLTGGGESNAVDAVALGFATLAIDWAAEDLASSLDDNELWMALVTNKAATTLVSELALWRDVGETLASIPSLHRVSALRPLVRFLADRSLLGWRVLLHITCHVSGPKQESLATRVSSSVPLSPRSAQRQQLADRELPSSEGATLLLNCLQSVLDDSSLKPDASKVVLQSLFQSSVATPAEVAGGLQVSFNFAEIVYRILNSAPLASLVRLMEAPETFECEYAGRRLCADKTGTRTAGTSTGADASSELYSEAAERHATGIKGLELEISKVLLTLRAAESPIVELMAVNNMSSATGYLDKLASLVRLICDKDLISLATESLQVGEAERGNSTHLPKKTCLGDAGVSSGILMNTARIYLSLITASAGLNTESISAISAAATLQHTAALLLDASNRHVSVHQSALNTLAFSRPREPLSGRLWSALGRLVDTDLLTEALALHDDWQLDQLRRGSLFSSASSSSNVSSALSNAAMALGMAVDTLCAGVTDVFVLFCAVYCHQLAATDDEELFAAPHSFPASDLQSLVTVLKRHLHKLFVSSFLPMDRDTVSSQTLAGNKLLLSRLFKQTTLAKLWSALYARSERRPFVPETFWQWDGITALASDYRQRMWNLEHSTSDGELDMATFLSSASMKPLLTCLPQMIPFAQRIELLQTLIASDRSQADHHGFHGHMRVHVRRDNILEDTVTSLSAASAKRLKGRVQVEFVSGLGGAEAGIDGGGLTKEWADLAAKAVFSPSKGFFLVNEDQLVMPHPSSHLAAPDSPHSHLQYFKAFGRLLGIIVYNRILVDAQFAGTFLNALLGRVNQIDDLWVVDKSLHRSLMSLKQLAASTTVSTTSSSSAAADPVAALGLTFEVTKAHDARITEELIPGGSSVPVTRANVRSYIHRYANYKVNMETAQQCRAFLSGFRELVALEWLSMFSARELQLLISGEQKPIDIDDMRRHVNYSGGYSDSHPFIEQFWDIVRHMTPHEQPLLGFSQLHPHFGIAQVFPYDLAASGDREQQPRLPTAATCMNLLKLPFYDSKEVLREKLLYAITSESGFELS